MARSYYSLLGVAEDAKAEEIRLAWGRAMAKLKPRVDAGEQEARGEAADITKAYETLSNPSRRNAYDLALERAKMDRDASIASMRQPDGGFWTGGKIGAMLLVLVLVGGGYGYYRAEQKKAAQLAAQEAEKRAQLLAEQERALKQKEHDELYAPLTDEEKARLQAKQDAEIRRLESYGHAVGSANTMAERRQQFDKVMAQQQKHFEQVQAQRREQQDARDLQEHQQEELRNAQRKLQQLENNR